MEECFISVDIETTGPTPGIYSMYELGACVVGDDAKRFFEEIALLPGGQAVPEALNACGHSIEELQLKGREPALVMRRFDEWVRKVSAGKSAVFVAHGATFDWMFVEWYFRIYLGDNPFGHAGLDIKSFYMGLMRSRWGEAKASKMDPRFLSEKPHTHNALDDAIQQADMFAKMLAHAGLRP